MKKRGSQPIRCWLARGDGAGNPHAELLSLALPGSERTGTAVGCRGSKAWKRFAAIVERVHHVRRDELPDRFTVQPERWAVSTPVQPVLKPGDAAGSARARTRDRPGCELPG